MVIDRARLLVYIAVLDLIGQINENIQIRKGLDQMK